MLGDRPPRVAGVLEDQQPSQPPGPWKPEPSPGRRNSTPPTMETRTIPRPEKRHAPDRRNERNPRPCKPKFSQSQLSNEPPIVETSAETEKKILHLTRLVPMLLL
jgi:hypothetical protein